MSEATLKSNGTLAFNLTLAGNDAAADHLSTHPNIIKLSARIVRLAKQEKSYGCSQRSFYRASWNICRTS
jgi:hypothetical protein